MSVRPLFIGVKDITDVLEAHPVYIARSILDPCIFALDNIYIEDGTKQAPKKIRANNSIDK